MINNPLIRVNDDLLIVKRIMDEAYIELSNDWKQISPLNRTFKKDNKVFFCELIEEAEIIEGTVENQIN
jgi:hypothetical protein